MWPRGLKPLQNIDKEASNLPQTGLKPLKITKSSLMKHHRARTKQKRLKPRPQNGSYTKHEQESPRHQNQRKWKALQTFTQNLSECGHAQPQTTANTDNLKPVKIMNKTASKQPQTPQSASKSSATTQNMLQTFGWRQSTCLNHSLLDSQSINSRPPNHSQQTKKPRLQPTSQPQPTNQPKQPTHRPTDRRTGQPASQPISPTCQPTNQPTNKPASPATCGARALKPTPREQATCHLPKLEPLSAPQNEVHNL